MSMALLEYHKRFLEEYLRSGYIDENDYFILRKEIDRKIVRLENHVF